MHAGDMGDIGGNVLEGLTNSVTSMAVSPDSQFMVSSHGSNGQGTVFTSSTEATTRVWVWDTTTWRNTQTLYHAIRGPSKEVLSVAYSPDSQFVATGAADGVRIWNTTTWNLTRTYDYHVVRSVAVSPDSRSVVSGKWCGSHDGHGSCGVSQLGKTGFCESRGGRSDWWVRVEQVQQPICVPREAGASVDSTDPSCRHATATCSGNGTDDNDWKSGWFQSGTAQYNGSCATCSGRGVGQYDGSCVCFPASAGPACQFTNSATCSGNGVPQKDGSCNCSDPAVGTGPSCSEYSNSATCSGHGVAQQDGSCDCFAHVKRATLTICQYVGVSCGAPGARHQTNQTNQTRCLMAWDAVQNSMAASYPSSTYGSCVDGCFDVSIPANGSFGGSCTAIRGDATNGRVPMHYDLGCSAAASGVASGKVECSDNADDNPHCVDPADDGRIGLIILIGIVIAAVCCICIIPFGVMFYFGRACFGRHGKQQHNPWDPAVRNDVDDATLDDVPLLLLGDAAAADTYEDEAPWWCRSN